MTALTLMWVTLSGQTQKSQVHPSLYSLCSRGGTYPLPRPHPWIGCWFQKWYLDQYPADMWAWIYPQGTVEKSAASSMSSLLLMPSWHSYSKIWSHDSSGQLMWLLMGKHTSVQVGQQHTGVFFTLKIRGLVCIESLTTPTLGDDIFPARRTIVLILLPQLKKTLLNQRLLQFRLRSKWGCVHASKLRVPPTPQV